MLARRAADQATGGRKCKFGKIDVVQSFLPHVLDVTCCEQMLKIVTFIPSFRDGGGQRFGLHAAVK
jgi:hypothetical protein